MNWIFSEYFSIISRWNTNSTFILLFLFVNFAYRGQNWKLQITFCIKSIVYGLANWQQHSIKIINDRKMCKNNYNIYVRTFCRWTYKICCVKLFMFSAHLHNTCTAFSMVHKTKGPNGFSFCRHRLIHCRESFHSERLSFDKVMAFGVELHWFTTIGDFRFAWISRK